MTIFLSSLKGISLTFTTIIVNPGGFFTETQELFLALTQEFVGSRGRFDMGRQKVNL